MPTAVDWLDRRARLSPQRTALIDAATGARISYADWNAAANRTARFLTGPLGLLPGERVAILAGNCVAYLDLLFACNKTGAVLQNLNWRLAENELAELIRDAAPAVLFYGPDFQAAVEHLWGADACACVRDWVALEGEPLAGDATLAARDEESPETPEMPALDHDDPWVICYTGGTTGLPKGAILSHGNITWNAINTVSSWGLGPGDTAILNAPLFHTGALNVFTTPLVHTGGCSIVCSGFDANQVFDLIAGGEVSLFFGVPTMFSMLQEHARWDEADFSPLKLVISGGAPCPLPVFERFWQRGVDFKTGYGLTEAGPNTFWLPPEQVRDKPGAVGYPLFHVEVALLDNATGEPVTAPDTTGELLIRGPHRTPGYWNRPDATAEAIDPEGWLHTGDLARFDADGAYTIVGRLKDMFISGGENVYPAEIENALHAHPEISDAAVFGLPDKTWGEIGCAVVVRVAGAELQARTLRAWLKERLARYKVPRRIEFADALPTTGAGKIDKRALQERYTDE